MEFILILRGHDAFLEYNNYFMEKEIFRGKSQVKWGFTASTGGHITSSIFVYEGGQASGKACGK